MTVVAPIVLAPPNHKYHAFTMADLVSTVSDSCIAGLGIADVQITQITSDEPEDGIGDGNTLNDIVIGSDCRSAELRVERSGAGNGRVYTISLHVTDLAGNRTEASVKVLVPTSTCLDNTAVDDGPHFTVPSTCP
jgi:endo-1,4-beta-xylanase